MDTNKKLAGPIELIRSAWSLFAANWKHFVLMTVFPLLVISLGKACTMSGSVPLLLVGMILTIIGIVAAIVMQIALLSTAHQISSVPAAPSTPIWQQYRSSLKLFWPFLGVVIMVMAILFLSTLLFLIPALIVGIYTSMYAAAFVIDGKRGWGAISYSWSLVRHRWWGTFGRLFCVGFMAVICSIAALIIMSGLATVIGLSLRSSGASALYALGSAVLNVFIAPFATVYMYKLYQSLKASQPVPIVPAAPTSPAK